MIVVTYPPAVRRTGLGPPRAIRHFTDAIAQARAEPQAPSPTAQAPIPLRPLRPMEPGPVRRDRVVVRLWLPLTLLFLLLAPFALLLAPLGYFAPRRLRVRPLAAVFAFGAVLLSLGGTDVEVDTPAARIQIKIF